MLVETSRAVISALRGFGAIDIDSQGWVVEALLEANICETRNLAQLGKQLVRHLLARLDIVALKLHIDRSGQPEVEYLGGDVGGQEVESGVRKETRQLLAQLLTYPAVG